MWTLILVLVASVTMIGPTQALSGLISTSLNVLDFMRGVVDSDTTSEPAAARARAADSSVEGSDVPSGDSALASADVAPEESRSGEIGDDSSASSNSAAGRSSQSGQSSGNAGSAGSSSSAVAAGGAGGGGAGAGDASASVDSLPSGVMTLDEVIADASLARDSGLDNTLASSPERFVLESTASDVSLGVDPSDAGDLGGGPGLGPGPGFSPPETSDKPSDSSSTQPEGSSASQPEGSPSLADPLAEGLAPFIPALSDEPSLAPTGSEDPGDAREPGALAVPEPGTAILLSLGLAAVARQARRRKLGRK